MQNNKEEKSVNMQLNICVQSLLSDWLKMSQNLQENFIMKFKQMNTLIRHGIPIIIGFLSGI